jgi:hypothetical protein
MPSAPPGQSKTLTHEDLAKATRVSVTTIKNYRRQFGQFLPVAREGRPLKFHASALDVCRRIHGLFGDGLSACAVSDALHSEFPAFFKNRHLSKASSSEQEKALSLAPGEPGTARIEQGEDLSKRLEAVETMFENTNRRVGRVEKLLEDLFTLHNRANTLQNELLAKIEAMAPLPSRTGYPDKPSASLQDSARQSVAEEPAQPGYAPRAEAKVLFEPPADLAQLPVVIFSELGEFLGVTDKKGRPFTLKEFQAFLERRAAGLGKFESTWSLDQEAWVLTFGGSGPSSGQVHDHYFRRTKTAKGNLVAHFHQLRINGSVVSQAFLHAFLRQIKDSLE